MYGTPEQFQSLGAWVEPGEGMALVNIEKRPWPYGDDTPNQQFEVLFAVQADESIIIDHDGNEVEELPPFPEQPKLYTEEQVMVAVNSAVDDVLAAAEAGDEGLRDVGNLISNATGTYLSDPDADLDAVIGECYQIAEGEDGPLEWIKR